MKRTSRRLSFHEMVDFRIRKRYFGGCVRKERSGRPPGEKKECSYSRPIGRKKVRALLPKKRTFGGEGGRSNLSTGQGALAKRGALACAHGALGLFTLYVRSTLGLPLAALAGFLAAPALAELLATTCAFGPCVVALALALATALAIASGNSGMPSRLSATGIGGGARTVGPTTAGAGATG